MSEKSLTVMLLFLMLVTITVIADKINDKLKVQMHVTFITPCMYDRYYNKV